MNKTIIYYGGFTLPDKSAAANRVVSNGKIFDSLGYNTVFIGAAPSDEAFDGLRPVEGCGNMFEQAHPKSSSEWIKHMFSVSHIDEIAEKYGNVERVILYNAPFFTLLRAKKHFRKKNIKVCYDCTEWTKDTDGSFLKRVFKAFDEILIRNFAHKLADGMIVISRMMEEKYKSAENLLLLPPLVDTSDAIWHQKTEADEGIFEFCFAGIPDGNKESLDKVVEAFLSLNRSDIRLRIIGITAEEFRKIYPDCSAAENVQGKIIFMGRLSHAETIKYVLGCGCYIFIRRSDRRNNAGFPTKFAESFTCGVPIITTDVSDVGTYIKKSGKGCLLENMSTESIAKAMLLQAESKGGTHSLNTAFHYGTFTDSARDWLKK